MTYARFAGYVDLRPSVKARPQQNVDRKALIRDIAKRYPKIHAELAKS